MAFQASALLEKFGWEAGKGLGRSESGDVEAIKVARKSNTKGLGERGSHWGNDWWDRMYTKALDNVDKKESKDTNSEKKDSLLFGSFTKAKSLNTMVNQSEESDYESEESSSEEDPEEKRRKQKATHHMHDDDVFEACNGMILRKFVPLGKLERIAKQEAEWKQKFSQVSTEKHPEAEPISKNSKKRKRETNEELISESPKKKQKTKSKRSKTKEATSPNIKTKEKKKKKSSSEKKRRKETKSTKEKKRKKSKSIE